MEASRFGFGRDFAAAFKFDPTDADIVAFYLLPRAVGLDKPHPHDHAHAVIDDDPISLPPWDLMEKHNHGTSDQAFFYGPPRNRGRVTRVVPGEGGGTWQRQNGSVGTVTLFCDSDGAGAGEVDISYRRYDLTYKRAGDKEPSGWVMSEYQITSPPLLSMVLTRIGLNVAAREQRRRRLANPEALAQQGPDKVLAAAAAATAEHQRVSPAPVQPGPDAQDALYHGGTSVTGVGEMGGHYTVPLLLNGQEYYKDKSRVKRRRYGS